MQRTSTGLLATLLMFCVSCSPSQQTPRAPSADKAKPSQAFIPLAEKSAKELESYHVILETSLGQIELGFLPEIAPEHVRNFLRLSQLGFYDHTAWHRVIRGSFIQGGDLGTRNPPLQMAEMAGGVKNLKPEFSRLKHQEGTVSMARGDAPDSAETSFFICVAPQPRLDNKYTIFGKVLSGMDVVQKIASVRLGEKGKPRERVELVRAQIIEAKPRQL